MPVPDVVPQNSACRTGSRRARYGRVVLPLRHKSRTDAVMSRSILRHSRRTSTPLKSAPSSSTALIGGSAPFFRACRSTSMRNALTRIIHGVWHCLALIITLPTAVTAIRLGGTTLSPTKGVFSPASTPFAGLRDVPPDASSWQGYDQGRTACLQAVNG